MAKCPQIAGDARRSAGATIMDFREEALTRVNKLSIQIFENQILKKPA